MAILTNSTGSVRATSPADSSASWQQEMKLAIRSLDRLAEELDLDLRHAGSISAVKDFPVFVPRPYLSRIQPGNIRDPLLLQVMAVPDEDVLVPGFSTDPLAEMNVNPAPGLLHKYRGRALMVTTGACAIHCRYCFRRHFPYQESPNQIADWEPAFQLIERDPTISEVILSGGDPLTMVDERIASLMDRIDRMDHVQRIRIHTRLPIVIPSRVNASLTEILDRCSSKVTVVVHANHANEIDSFVQGSLRELKRCASLVLNQSVLLQGVNDSVDALVDLSQRLLDCDVLPYYLHQLDPVAGAAHFAVNRETGKQLIEEMRGQLPGYAVPRYVQEIAGEHGKTVLA